MFSSVPTAPISGLGEQRCNHHGTPENTLASATFKNKIIFKLLWWVILAFTVLSGSGCRLTSLTTNGWERMLMSCRYMNAAKIGEDVLITAHVLKQGRTLAFATVDLTSKATGKLIAQGRHTKHLGSS